MIFPRGDKVEEFNKFVLIFIPFTPSEIRVYYKVKPPLPFFVGHKFSERGVKGCQKTGITCDLKSQVNGSGTRNCVNGVTQCLSVDRIVHNQIS